MGYGPYRLGLELGSYVRVRIMVIGSGLGLWLWVQG